MHFNHGLYSFNLVDTAESNDTQLYMFISNSKFRDSIQIVMPYYYSRTSIHNFKGCVDCIIYN
jgi:hypothetical protein